MACNKCPLNIESENFCPEMYRGIPLHAKALFVCKNTTAKDDCGDLFSIRQLCVRDLWVLTFIGSKERFAVEKAAETLDHLVIGGHSELLGHLFENASYEVRRTLWLRMTNSYPDRLYMFDSMFEKESLPPIASGGLPENIHVYRHYLLYSGGPANSFVKDL